ncbi:phospholipase D family protein [Roseicella aquatilis]|uniref:Phospholipase D-like domain-containing protein n=1 Tax=Roseicella aquatilis TaxID=2527868 RepID=A0A4R4D882_9PROT|nr:phospholipase D family protein [Roseicella aquatilis]TCZ55968.1 hypothetical protein EXY23_20435 [Roseicella aquatilis]
MTSRLLTEADTAKEIRKLVAGAEARVAVAYWGATALELLGLDAAAKGTKVICNLESGCTDPATIRQLRSRLGEANVKTHAGLHAKVCLGVASAILGSSNASMRGLGGSNGWREANLLCNDPRMLSQLSAWFDQVWDEAILIREAALRKADAAWQRRRVVEGRQTDPVPLIQTALSDSSIRAQNIWIALYREYVSKEDKAAIRQAWEARRGGDGREPKLPRGWYPYTNWPRWPDDAILIDCRVKKNGSARCHGLYRTPPKSLRLSFSDENWADFATKATTITIDGFTCDLPMAERQQIEAHAAKWLGHRREMRMMRLSECLDDLEPAEPKNSSRPV